MFPDPFPSPPAGSPFPAPPHPRQIGFLKARAAVDAAHTAGLRKAVARGDVAAREHPQTTLAAAMRALSAALEDAAALHEASAKRVGTVRRPQTPLRRPQTPLRRPQTPLRAPRCDPTSLSLLSVTTLSPSPHPQALVDKLQQSRDRMSERLRHLHDSVEPALRSHAAAMGELAATRAAAVKAAQAWRTARGQVLTGARRAAQGGDVTMSQLQSLHRHCAQAGARAETANGRYMRAVAVASKTRKERDYVVGETCNALEVRPEGRENGGDRGEGAERWFLLAHVSFTSPRVSCLAPLLHRR